MQRNLHQSQGQATWSLYSASQPEQVFGRIVKNKLKSASWQRKPCEQKGWERLQLSLRAWRISSAKKE